MKRGLIISAVFSVACFLSLDWYLGLDYVVDPRIREARALGVEFDGRRPIEVVWDTPGTTLQVIPEDFAARGIYNIYPLSNPALSRVVLCNESGSYVIIETDEYGFNNPLGIWDGSPDLLLIGDSYTEGWCVQPGQSFADLIRDLFPLTLNLGRAGRGPLSELVILREYAPYVQPKRIVWFFHDNDFRNLNDEMSVPMLRRYMEVNPGMNLQGLYERRVEVNFMVKEFVDGAIDTLTARRHLPFYGTRHLINGLIGRFRESEDPWIVGFAQKIGAFAVIMRRAKEISEESGAELLFVYLRDYRKIGVAAEAARMRSEAVLAVVSDLGIPHFTPAGSAEFHRLSPAGGVMQHYNQMGHRPVAEQVVKWLGEM